MASFMESTKQPKPKEHNEPRRRTPTRAESHGRHGADAWRRPSYDSEAASRHDIFVPVVHAVLAPAEGQAIPEASAPIVVADDQTSQSSSERMPEVSEYGESALGTETSTQGSYSLYSQGFSNYTQQESEAGTSQRGREPGEGGRFVGSRDWARHQESQISRNTTSTMSENPWSGPGREESEESGRVGGGGRPGDPPPYPITQDASRRSMMSHDLSGFSDFDPQPPASDRDLGGSGGAGAAGGTTRGASITAPHLAPSDPQNLAWIGAGTSAAAAAAAAADATNAEAAVRSAKQANERRGGGSGGGNGGKLPKPPGPHGGGGSGGSSRVGDFKEETDQGGMSAFRASTLEAARTHGDPYDERPRNENGTTGEYAIPTYYSLIFTPLMFLICAILLFWEFSLNEWEAQPLAENPSFGPSVEILIEAGAKRTDLIVDNGDWWRLWTPMFLHAGVIHFLFNMLGFLQVGAMVERVFGWWRVASIYLVAGVFGTLVSAIFVPTAVMVGASGAILGVFGALWADLWQNWSVNQEKCRMLTVLTILTVANIVLGLMPFLDNFAHIGGMIMGFLMGLALLVQEREDDLGDRLGKKCYQTTLQLVAVIAVPTLLILGLSLLYGRSDPSEWCGWCENISCVEFPPGNDPWWHCDECSTVGFTAEIYDNGSISIGCPDTVARLGDAECSAASESLLLECCINTCL